MTAPQRLVRALQHGGVAERTTRGVYTVWRSANRARRPAGQMSWRDGDALFKAKHIKPSVSGPRLYVWCGEAEVPNEVPFEVPFCLSNMGPHLAAKRQAPRTLLSRALDRSSLRNDRARAAMAASRFIGLHELAYGSGISGMSWTGEPAGRGSGITSRAPIAAKQIGAGRDLDRLTCALGGEAYAILTRALIGEVTAASLARSLAVSPTRAITKLAAALKDLAHAFDQQVAAEREG